MFIYLFIVSTFSQAKLLGSCQSAIELAKHLHELLVNDGNLSNETAKISEVNELIERYDNLLIRARLREQQIRDIRSAKNIISCLWFTNFMVNYLSSINVHALYIDTYRYANDIHVYRSLMIEVYSIPCEQ